MCGCQTNVKYIKSNKEEPVYNVPAPRRKLNTSCDTFGNCGRVETNTLTTSEGAIVVFTRTSYNNTSFPKEAFTLGISGSATVIGLRQLAEEFAAMADELDKQKTIVAIVNHVAKPKAKKKKAKTVKRKK